MKRHLLAFVGLLPFALFSQQFSSNCVDQIKFNKISIPISPFATWYDIEPITFSCNHNMYHMEIEGDSAYPVYSSFSYIYGKPSVTQNPIGNLNTYTPDLAEDSLGNIYHDMGAPTFRMGPYSPNALIEESNWQKYWVITRYDIDQHLMNFTNPSYTVPNAFATWPAHGDTTLGESFNLAPFHDYNTNGVYDPENGDYPLIKGYKCVYAIMNDIWQGTNSTQLPYQLNLEIHKMWYSFDCHQDSALTNTVFVEHKIINKGSQPIDELTYGNWIDFDIGGANDDYIASDVERGIAYAYNGDMFDEDANGQYGYGDYIPAQAFGVLHGMKRPDNGVDDGVHHSIESSYNGYGYADGIIDNEYFGLTSAISNTRGGFSWSSDPNNYNRFWNYLSGRWFDNTPMYYGGIGHISNSTTNYETKFIYPGDSDPNHYGTSGIDPGFDWSEDLNLNQSGDRRIFAATQGTTLNPGETTSILTYYTYGRDRQSPGRFPSVAKMKSFVDDIRSYYHANQTPCGTDFDYYQAHQFLGIQEGNIEGKVSVYPNPSNKQITISGIEMDQALVQIYDSRGALVMNVQNPESSTFTISHLEKGVYILNIVVEDGVVSKKIIKE